ncbi:hypothetical protein [Pengzhenrongella sp.]
MTTSAFVKPRLDSSPGMLAIAPRPKYEVWFADHSVDHHGKTPL